MNAIPFVLAMMVAMSAAPFYVHWYHRRLSAVHPSFAGGSVYSTRALVLVVIGLLLATGGYAALVRIARPESTYDAVIPTFLFYCGSWALAMNLCFPALHARISKAGVMDKLSRAIGLLFAAAFVGVSVAWLVFVWAC